MTKNYNKKDLEEYKSALAAFKAEFSNAQIEYGYAEVYVWNKFTIQFNSTGREYFEGVSVEIYFDSERLDHHNKIKCFSKNQIGEAITYARKLVKIHTGDLLTDVLSESD